MKTDINLLSASQSEAKKEKKTLSLVRTLAVISVIFLAIISVLAFLVIQSISPAPIEREVEELSQKFSPLRPKQAKLILLKQKLSDIQNIIEKRSEYNAVLSQVVENIPQGAVVNSLNIDEEKIQASVGSGSLVIIDEFLINFLNMVKNKEIIGNLTVENISFDTKTGVYTVSISGNRI